MRIFPNAPLPSPNSAHHAAIQSAYRHLAEERSKFLAEQRLVVGSDSRMPAVVRKKLIELGCGEYWSLLHNGETRTNEVAQKSILVLRE